MSTRSGWAYLTASIVLVSMAQLLLKVAMTQGMPPDFTQFTLATASSSVSWFFLLLLGAICYACSMLTWVGTLARLPVSIAYPALSLSFPLVFLVAAWLPSLQESFSSQRLLGIVMVVLGNAVIVRGGIGSTNVTTP